MEKGKAAWPRRGYCLDKAVVKGPTMWANRTVLHKAGCQADHQDWTRTTRVADRVEKKAHGAATAIIDSHFFLTLIGEQEEDTGCASRTPRGQEEDTAFCKRGQRTEGRQEEHTKFASVAKGQPPAEREEDKKRTKEDNTRTRTETGGECFSPKREPQQETVWFGEALSFFDPSKSESR